MTGDRNIERAPAFFDHGTVLSRLERRVAIPTESAGAGGTIQAARLPCWG